MRHLASLLVVVLVSSLGVSACGGNIVKGTGASGTGGTGTTTATATTGITSTTVLPAGDCATDADCNGGQCVELTPGGYKVCTHFPPEATACTPSQLDQCCTSADCKGGGKCYAVTDLPSCAGIASPPHNECVTDQCTDDAACTGGGADVPMICIPAGAAGYPARSCFPAYCHTSASCTAHPGGACVPVHEACCGHLAGLGCVYPGGCVENADCGQGNSCQLDSTTGTGTCVAGPPICPV
jgi:hypothetical protein